jgi:hypothetical protein
MEPVELEKARQQLDGQVRSRFPADAIDRVELLQHGDVPEVEPGQLLAQVILHAPGDREERARAFKALHDEHRAAFEELRKELNKLPGNVVLRIAAGGEHPEGNPTGPFIRIVAQKSNGPGGDAVGLTPVMARLGADDLETLDTLISAGIAGSRAEAVRWALARIRERPAYEQLRARTREIAELKSQF